MERVHSQKRLVLGRSGEAPLPFMVWSAGQREFVPLLVGLYWLLPAAKVPSRAGLERVIIEELEMGLHPRAITAVLLLVMDLLWRGYSVCLSTHSPQVLDFLWALRVFRDRGAEPGMLLRAFNQHSGRNMTSVARAVLGKTCRVYLFQPNGRTEDISTRPRF